MVLLIVLVEFVGCSVSHAYDFTTVTPATYDSCVSEVASVLTKNDVNDHLTPEALAKHHCYAAAKNSCLKNPKQADCSKFGVSNSFADLPLPSMKGGKESVNNDDCADPSICRIQPAPKKKAKVPVAQSIDPEIKASVEKAKRKASTPTKDSNGQPTNSPIATTPKPMQEASTESTSDTGQCSVLVTAAKNQCKIKQSSNSSGKEGGMSDYCKQLSEASATGSDTNANAATICYNSYRDCVRTCGDLADKYDTLTSKCGSCSSSSVYAQAAEDMRSSRSTCNELSAVVAQLADQSSSMAGDSMNSEMCKEAAKAAGSNSSVGAESSRMNSAAATNSQSCATHPTGPGCTTAASAVNVEPAGTATASGSSAATGGSLNVSDPGSLATEDSFGGSGFGGGGGNVPKINTIANNTGGGIPGSGGGGGNGGILGGNGAGGLFGAAKSSITDIDKGMRSGGYSAPGGSGLETPDGEGGYSAKAPGATDDGRGPAGIDLKDYLPGGRLAANGIHTGSVMPVPREIGGPHVDLWSRITDKYQLMCKLGQLFDCK